MKFGYFTLTDNAPAYGERRRDPGKLVHEVLEECVEAEAMGFNSAWVPEHHLGVFGVGRPPTSALERASAAVLACGPGAALSHHSALTLWGFDRTWRFPVHVSSPTWRRRPGIGRCLGAGRCITSRRRIGLRRRGQLECGRRPGGRLRLLAEGGKFLLHGVREEIAVAREPMVALEVPIGRPGRLAQFAVDRALVVAELSQAALGA